MISTRIRQIYFKPAQVGLLDDSWEPCENTSRVTPIFENQVIKDLYLEGDHKSSDYYGVFSYKFFNKHRKQGVDIERLISQDEYQHDVYSFFKHEQFKSSTKKNTFFDPYHPNLLEIGSRVVKRLFNANIRTIKAERIYYNHWLAKSEVFDSYCKEMLLPAIDLMNGELKELTWSNANYRARSDVDERIMGMMTPERCLEVFGVPYYTHHAFVLERLPSIYFALKGYSIKQL